MLTKRSVPHTINLRAFSPGASAIYDVWLVVDGSRVNSGEKVASGKKFVVMANFKAVNGSTGLLNAWSACLTVTDATGTVRNYRLKDSSFSIPPNEIASSSLEINAMGENIMPDNDLTLRVKLWGSDQLHPQPAYPDISLW